MKTDKNSLFKCFSMFLYDEENKHLKLREEIVQYIFKNWDYFKKYLKSNIINSKIKNYNDYFKIMIDNEGNGDILEAICFSDVYKVFVSISNSKCTIFEYGDNTSLNSLHLLMNSKIFMVVKCNKNMKNKLLKTEKKNKSTSANKINEINNINKKIDTIEYNNLKRKSYSEENLKNDNTIKKQKKI